jgi:ABC-type multidrug transport system ATPase subunit
MPSSVIEVRGLVKKYGDRVAVNRIDLSVLEGEIAVLRQSTGT